MRNSTSSFFLRCAVLSAGAVSLLSAGSSAAAQSYKEVRLVSDTAAGGGAKTDPNLVNPWGLAAFPGNPWWVSDEGTGLSTLYDGSGNIQGLVVTIPPSASAPPGSKGSPTGIIANTTSDFGGAAFIFDSIDGTISTWSGAPSATVVVDKGAGTVYTGLALGQMNGVNVLYAANFPGGAVEAYDTNFNPITLAAGAFTDPKLPAGYAPFNVQVLNGNVFVTFALRDPNSPKEKDGPGLGFVEEFDTTGKSIMRFAHGLYLNAPWGVAVAPSNFGEFSNDVLVGNFGSGKIIAFDHSSGQVKGILKDSSGKPIQIGGLWALGFGLGGQTGPTNWLYFTAGIKEEAHGVFGYFVAQ